MKTYKIPTIEEILKKDLKNLYKEETSIVRFKKFFAQFAPVFLKDAKIVKVQDETVFLKTNENAIVLKYKEKEILEFLNRFNEISIKKVKIISN